VLRQALNKFFCYATVFQAIELFSLARSETEAHAVEDSMASVKILGLNPKNARKYGELLGHRKRPGLMAVLVAGLCKEGRLPLLTDRKKEFKSFPGLLVVSPRLVEKYDTGAEILNTARGTLRKLEGGRGSR
jgi:predicted nucleic acid-binding protein